MSNRTSPSSALRPGGPLFRIALAATLAALLLHAWLYRFLTDDAYIAFRFARNFGDGLGLVFNPGGERVEGYANFLWIVLVGALHRLGVPCEVGSLTMSMVATVLLWAAVTRVTWCVLPADGRRWWALLPPALLALTRSVAVWSTSGMETRAFELLVFVGVARAAVERTRVLAGERPRPWAAVSLGLATLVRPEGALLTAAAAVTFALFSLRDARVWRWLGRAMLVWLLFFGGHLAFRLSYYGEWLPNVYYTKVDGQSWWGMGAAYVGCFALEYGAALWVLPLGVGLLSLARNGRAAPAAAAFSLSASLILYIAKIGGDHFEYRPLDLVFPFAFVAIAVGAAELSRGRIGAVLAGGYMALLTVFLVELPRQSRIQYPDQLQPGFPGLSAPTAYLDPAQSPVYRWPGLAPVARKHKELLERLTTKFVGLRREEHAMFIDVALHEGRRVRLLIDQGVLPEDTHLAIDCVGAVPYLSDLETFDRLGLTNAEVARGEFVTEFMAHGKHATLEQAVEHGVDLWAVDPLRLHWHRDEPQLRRHIGEFHARGEEVGFAPIGTNYYLLAWFPQGVEPARERFPQLDLQSTTDPAAVDAFFAQFTSR